LGGGEIAAAEAAARLLHLINTARMLRSLKITRRTRKAYQIIIEDPKEMSTRDVRVQILKILKNR